MKKEQLQTHVERFETFKNDLSGTDPDKDSVKIKFLKLNFKEYINNNPKLKQYITSIPQFISLDSVRWVNSNDSTIYFERDVKAALFLLGEELKKK